jgi:hypothetical protein
VDWQVEDRKRERGEGFSGWRAHRERAEHIRPARVRRYVWSQFPDGLPTCMVAGTDFSAELVVLDVDATIVVANSEKRTQLPRTPAENRSSPPPIRARCPAR